MPLALVGAVLFGARLVDAIADPLLGMAMDRSPGQGAYRRWIRMSVLPLLVGFVAMLHPPAWSQHWLAAWLAAGSVLTYVAWSSMTIAHQAWGAALSANSTTRVRVTGIREACGLVGVLASAALLEPHQASVLAALFAIALVVSAILLGRAPLPRMRTRSSAGLGSAWRDLRTDRTFLRLLAVFMLNGTASALPATLILFFVADVLGSASSAPVFLLLYFAAAALGMPLWIRLGVRLGTRRAWLVGMLAALLAFAWAFALGQGELIAFGAICAITGLALGADLAMPTALLASVIATSGRSGAREGAYFGVWSLATKLNLALAAGLGLPLIGVLGYQPGVAESRTFALSFAYAALPCLIKLAAVALLWRLRDLDEGSDFRRTGVD